MRTNSRKLTTPQSLNAYIKSIYCRKSTEEEERQVLSIEAQLTELREYIKRERLFVIEEFTESQTAKEPGDGES